MSDSDSYAGQRYDPTLAHCHPISLLFDGNALTMFASGKRLHSYPAVSGQPLPSKNGKPKRDYSVARQKLGSVGPIPAGIYWVTTDELWDPAANKPASPRGWGDNRLTIRPFATTATHGRGAFFLHGGGSQGAPGNIDLSTQMDKFVHDLREQLGTALRCQIHLTVDYRMQEP